MLMICNDKVLNKAASTSSIRFIYTLFLLARTTSKAPESSVVRLHAISIFSSFNCSRKLRRRILGTNKPVSHLHHAHQ